jgi:hypothetical protein
MAGMTHYTDSLSQLGAQTAAPTNPEEAVLERVPNPHADTLYVARFTAPEFTSLCPVTGQPDFAMRTAPSPSASAWPTCCNRNGCASAATGTRAAASPSTSSGRRARPSKASGCRIRAWRPIAGGGERGGLAWPYCAAVAILTS